MSTSKGFTLIELMIVIAIIGILASIVIPAIKGDSHSAPSGMSYSRQVVQPSGPAPSCQNGFLMKGDKAVVNGSGEVVKC